MNRLLRQAPRHLDRPDFPGRTETSLAVMIASGRFRLAQRNLTHAARVGITNRGARRCISPARRAAYLWRSRRGELRHLTHKYTKRFSSTKSATEVVVVHTPPLPIRTALVATTTAIGTPAFPVVGFINIAFRYVVLDPQSRRALLGATTIGGAIYMTLKIAANDLLPWVYSYSQLFLPFAMVNGTLAGAAYTVLDVILGPAMVASTPWAGALMGAAVGAVGPMSGLYDVAFEWCWDIPDRLHIWDTVLNNSFVLPIATTTGAAVGAMLHPLMKFPITGIPGVSWVKFSAPLLALGTALMAHLYLSDSTYYAYTLDENTYLSDAERQNMALVIRFHVKTLEAKDWGSSAGYRPLGTGSEARTIVRAKLAQQQQGSQTPVFDTKRKAWLHHVTKGWVAPDNEAVLFSEAELGQKSQNLLQGDGAVAFVMMKGKDEQTETIRKDLRKLAEALQASVDKKPAGAKHARLAKRYVGNIELASSGIALLMIKQQEQKQVAKSGETISASLAKEINVLEQRIRKVSPGILLYRTDEEDGWRGCSVESQLDQFEWHGIVTNGQLLQRISNQWTTGIERLEHEEARARIRQIAWAATGLAAVAVGVGLFGKSSNK